MTPKSGYVLARVPIPYYPPARFSGLVVVGSDIYNNGSKSSNDSRPSSSVSVMDCRFHTWHEAPSMRVELKSLSGIVVDGKIYVAGNYGDSLERKYSFEVLDTKTETWDPLPPIPKCIDGKFHVKTDKGLFGYNSYEGIWYDKPRMMYLTFSDSYCKKENVLYAVSYKILVWYESEVDSWKKVKGLVGIRHAPPGVSVGLIDYGDKIAVLWEECLHSSGQKKIWCVEIALERLKRRKSFDIWGKVEWFDHGLTVPKGYDFAKALATTV